MASIIVPTSLSDITIWQLREFSKLDKTMPEQEYLLQMISIFCKVSVSEVRKVPIKVLESATDKIMVALQQKPRFKQRFSLKGIQYGFVPNLDEITTGEFVDIDSYQKDPANLWKVLSVLYRPVKAIEGDLYLVEEYKGKLVEDFKELDADTGYGALVFFWSIGTDLLNYTLKFLEKEQAKKTSQLMKRLSQKSGDGLVSSIALLKEMYSELTKSQEQGFILAYNGLPTNLTFKKWTKGNTKKQKTECENE